MNERPLTRFITVNYLKRVIKSRGYQTSSIFIHELNNHIEAMVLLSIVNANENKRKTVMAIDLEYAENFFKDLK